MAQLVVHQGYDLKLVGKPASTIVDAPLAQRVAVRPPDFRGLRPRLLVERGAAVKVGTPVLQSKTHPEILLVSPAAGTVAEIRRGARRALLEVVIEVAEREEYEDFGSLAPATASRDEIRSLLLRGGLWPMLRQHPFAKIAQPQDTPKAIFVTAVETEPFAADPASLLEGQGEDLQLGMLALQKLTDGQVHLTTAANAEGLEQLLAGVIGVERHTISGPHPAGHPAVHAFYVDRLKPGEIIWYLNAWQVALIGQLCRQGRFPTERIVALAGEGVQPEHRQHYRTRAGAAVEALLADRVATGESRVISGGVLTGANVGPQGHLGYHDAVLSAVPEGRRREVLGWMMPGANKYSWSRTFVGALAPADKEHSVDTNQQGSERACVQSGYCLEVCPLDLLPVFVWKAVHYDDLEEAEKLGILDCFECGLCTYVCPSKIDINGIIRQGLDRIEKEG